MMHIAAPLQDLLRPCQPAFSSGEKLLNLTKLQIARRLQCMNTMCTGQATTDPEVMSLQKDVREALKLDSNTDIAYTDLYDALTARKFHNKGWPDKMTEELYLRIEKEAFR